MQLTNDTNSSFFLPPSLLLLPLSNLPSRSSCAHQTNFSPFKYIKFYAGFLVSLDAYMNLQLASTEEYIDGQFTGNLGEVLIRCNNVLYLRGAPEDEGGS
jgi:small nuclear ribonucleoprotein F